MKMRLEDLRQQYELPLLKGIGEAEWENMIRCGCMKKQIVERGQRIFHMGDQIREIGIVLSGGVHIENTDFWGNRSILNRVMPGQVFGETYAVCQEPMMVDVTAAEPSEILFLDLMRLRQTPQGDMVWQSKIKDNLLHISMQKNLILSERIFCTAPKTVRGRLLVYLSGQSARARSTTFRIPFDRQGLADYLNLDRSALSKELGRMRDEGILEFHKNQFKIISLL